MSKLGLGRFKSWAGGVMSSSDARSNMSEELQRDLDEMDARCAGVERMERAMQTYVKYLQKRVPGEFKDTPYPTANLGSTMIRQSDDMPRDSELANRLAKFGQANVRIASFQEQYASDAVASWQEALDRSIAQMKDYQAARKVLEMRRKDFDSATARVAKSKRDDASAEEDLRKKTALYDESQRDVQRRIQDIRDAEDDGIEGLYRFLEAEIAFHENCMNALQRLRSEWEPRGQQYRGGSSRMIQPPNNRSRSNTARSVSYATVNEEDEYAQNYGPPRPPYGNYNRSNSYTYSYGDDESPAGSYSGQSHSRSHSPEPLRNNFRNPTSAPAFEGPTSSTRRNNSVREDSSYFPPPQSTSYRDRASTLPSREREQPSIPLRAKRSMNLNIFHSPNDYDSLEDTPAYQPRTPSTSSPSTTPGSDGMRMGATVMSSRKGPPPPPPPKRMVSASYADM